MFKSDRSHSVSKEELEIWYRCLSGAFSKYKTASSFPKLTFAMTPNNAEHIKEEGVICGLSTLRPFNNLTGVWLDIFSNTCAKNVSSAFENEIATFEFKEILSCVAPKYQMIHEGCHGASLFFEFASYDIIQNKQFVRLVLVPQYFILRLRWCGSHLVSLNWTDNPFIRYDERENTFVTSIGSNRKKIAVEVCVLGDIRFRENQASPEWSRLTKYVSSFLPRMNLLPGTLWLKTQREQKQWKHNEGPKFFGVSKSELMKLYNFLLATCDNVCTREITHFVHVTNKHNDIMIKQDGILKCLSPLRRFRHLDGTWFDISIPYVELYSPYGTEKQTFKITDILNCFPSKPFNDINKGGIGARLFFEYAYYDENEQNHARLVLVPLHFVQRLAWCEEHLVPLNWIDNPFLEFDCEDILFRSYIGEGTPNIAIEICIIGDIDFRKIKFEPESSKVEYMPYCSIPKLRACVILDGKERKKKKRERDHRILPFVTLNL